MNQASQYSSAWKTKSTLFHRKINHIWFFQSPCVGCRYLKAVPFMFNWGYWGSDAHLTRPIYATLHRARYVARKGVHEMGQKSRTTLRARIGGLKIALSVQNTKPQKYPTSPFSTERRSWFGTGRISGSSLIDCPLAQYSTRCPHSSPNIHRMVRQSFANQ